MIDVYLLNETMNDYNIHSNELCGRFEDICRRLEQISTDGYVEGAVSSALELAIQKFREVYAAAELIQQEISDAITSYGEEMEQVIDAETNNIQNFNV